MVVQGKLTQLRLLCIVCGEEFTVLDGQVLNECPFCGDSDGTPGMLDAAFPVTFTHEELRLLITWAGLYVDAVVEQNPGHAAALSTGRARDTIIRRAAAQAPPIGFDVRVVDDEAEAEPVMTDIAREALARGEQVLTTTAVLDMGALGVATAPEPPAPPALTALELALAIEYGRDRHIPETPDAWVVLGGAIAKLGLQGATGPEVENELRRWGFIA